MALEHNVQNKNQNKENGSEIIQMTHEKVQ